LFVLQWFVLRVFGLHSVNRWWFKRNLDFSPIQTKGIRASVPFKLWLFGLQFLDIGLVWTPVLSGSIQFGPWSFGLQGLDKGNSYLSTIRTMVVRNSVIRTLILFGLQFFRSSVQFELWSFSLQGSDKRNSEFSTIWTSVWSFGLQ
jgi:hypothetical protein